MWQFMGPIPTWTNKLVKVKHANCTWLNDQKNHTLYTSKSEKKLTKNYFKLGINTLFSCFNTLLYFLFYPNESSSPTSIHRLPCTPANNLTIPHRTCTTTTSLRKIRIPKQPRTSRNRREVSLMILLGFVCQWRRVLKINDLIRDEVSSFSGHLLL